jgi:tetratricopeptide (TPR) repeat protein
MRRNAMNRIGWIAALGLVAAATLLSSGCNKLKARDSINKGVNAFKTGQYTEAADAFKTAIDLDPDLPVARLYLATAYMSQYIPGSGTVSAGAEGRSEEQARHDGHGEHVLPDEGFPQGAGLEPEGDRDRSDE